MILILLFLLMIGFFCGSEMGLISCDRIRLRHLEKTGSQLAKEALIFLTSPEKYLSTILTGTNLAMVATTAVATSLLHPHLGQTGKILLPFLITFTILIIGEILPKVLFRRWAENTTLLLVRPLKFFYFLFFPFIFLVNLVSRGILALFSLRPPERTPLVTKIGLEISLRESIVEGILPIREGKAIFSIFSFSQMTAKDVMIKREKIFSIPITFSREEIIEEVSKRGFERVPVLGQEKNGNDLEGVIGILRVVDLLKDEKIENILHPVHRVEETTRFHDLLKILREDVNHLALVGNENGKITGLVTLDDILKGLFGEIREELLNGE